jgi:hypothetical protein
MTAAYWIISLKPLFTTKIGLVIVGVPIVLSKPIPLGPLRVVPGVTPAVLVVREA